jgi:hypothetical protein
LDLFFAAVLRFVLRFFLVTAAGFFFAFEADFLRAFLAIGSPQVMQVCRHEPKRGLDLAPGVAASVAR